LISQKYYNPRRRPSLPGGGGLGVGELSQSGRACRGDRVGREQTLQGQAPAGVR